MPPQQRIGRRDRRDLPQGRTAHAVRPRSQPSTIVVGETRSAGPKLTPQEPVLFDQVRDRLPLSAVQPAGEHAQHHLKRRGIDHGAELTSRASLKDVGRELEHYAEPMRSRRQRAHLRPSTAGVEWTEDRLFSWRRMKVSGPGTGTARPDRWNADNRIQRSKDCSELLTHVTIHYSPRMASSALSDMAAPSTLSSS